MYFLYCERRQVFT